MAANHSKAALKAFCSLPYFDGRVREWDALDKLIRLDRIAHVAVYARMVREMLCSLGASPNIQKLLQITTNIWFLSFAPVLWEVVDSKKVISSRYRCLDSYRRTADTVVPGVAMAVRASPIKREAISVTSAWLHAFRDLFSTRTACSSLPWARRLCIKPDKDQIGSGREAVFEEALPVTAWDYSGFIKILSRSLFLWASLFDLLLLARFLELTCSQYWRCSVSDWQLCRWFWSRNEDGSPWNARYYRCTLSLGRALLFDPALHCIQQDERM